MRKDRIPAQNVQKVGGPRKVRCTNCRSEYALPIRAGKKLVYECPKCGRQFSFQNMGD